MATRTVLPIDRDSVLELSANRREPEWMTELRREALDLATALELPALEKMNIDRWTLNFGGLYKSSQRVRKPDELPENVRALVEEGEHPENLLIQCNSGIAYCSLSAELAGKGVLFTDLETALAQYPDLVKKYFMNCVKKEENRLTALHAGLWSGGVFLYVPKHVAVETPIQALFYTDDADARFAPHVLIVAEAGSSVTYVDNCVSGDLKQSAVLSGVVEVFVGPGATVNFASTHNLGGSVVDLTYRRAAVANDGTINWVIGEMNYGDSLSETTSLLQGNGSSSDTKVICVGTGEQKLHLTTRAVHYGKASASEMITRAVMRDQATSIINGITKIEKGATGANGEQTEKVLMLSPRARGDANPILLIDEDDVKAGHAASVGQVNPEQVYYMMSRGITKEEATKLIIYGFLAPVVSEIPIPKLKEQLQNSVERKLGQ